jgi:hypothetical protein
MSMEIKALERAAILAHKSGIGWLEFWQANADRVKQAQPYDGKKYRRLYLGLLSLVCTGEAVGMTPISTGALWLADDDATTHADVGMKDEQG